MPTLALRSVGRARGRGWVALSLGLLVGLLVAPGCSSTKPCNPDTVFLSVTFDAKTSAADKLEIDFSIDGAAPKTTTLAHKAGDTVGSVEITFPHGYPEGKRVALTVEAFKDTALLGTTMATIEKVAKGCSSVKVTFSSSGPDGGLPGTGGGAGGTTGTGGVSAGGSSGAGGSIGAGGGGGTLGNPGGAGGSSSLCTEASTRSCAADGALGACASGTETCTAGKWSACSIKPAAADLCDPKGDDSNCNGTTNDACACSPGDARLCSQAGAMGNCAKGAQSCVDGKWGPCSILPAALDNCATKGDDTNCNGVPNEGCECFVGDAPRLCSSAGAMGNCAKGTQACINGKWGACSVVATSADSCSVKDDDANCNGTPNDGCVCFVGDPARSCAVDGAKGNCAKGTETCTSAGKWSACSITPATKDLCDPKGDDATCNGMANEGCTCATGDTQACGPAAVGICKPGMQTCTNGTWGGCMGAVIKAPRDCTSAADNDCDGIPDNTIDLICKCAAGSTQVCGAHPGNDGKGPCKSSTQTCVVATDKTSSAFPAACPGAVGPAAADTCVSGNDDNCNGTKNEGCSCINAVTTRACGYCGDGSQTCTDGKTNTFGACSGGIPGQDFTALALTNGWTNAPFSTNNAAISLDCSGIVHFKGGIAGGTGLQPFVIPAALRPAADVYVPCDLVNSAKGRLNISASGGSVYIQPASGTDSDATNFTSLEGVSYALSTTGFTPLTLASGWTNAPYSTRNAAVSLSGGIVRFQGAVATTGTGTTVLTLPAAYIPPTTVYVNADMYGAAHGRLVINTDGTVNVEPLGDFSSAAMFTSLEGVWYAQSASGFTAQSLTTGWTNAPFGTRNASASVSGGIVRFQGAIAGDTTSTSSLFTLPAGMRPTTNIYTPLGLCDSHLGRLYVTPAGAVSVQVLSGNLSDAQCFTSLEGVSFAR